MSQVPMYNQFQPVQNQLYTPDVNELPVARATCIPLETLMYFPVPLISKVPPKHVYGTQLREDNLAMFIRILKEVRKFNQNKAKYHNVYTPRSSEPEEDNINTKNQSLIRFKTQYEKFLPENTTRAQWKTVTNVMHQSTVINLLTNCLHSATTTMLIFQRMMI